MFERTGMNPDQDFETFLRERAKERVWSMDDFLDLHDKKHMAEQRATELIELAKERGFGDNLMEIGRRFGSVLAYVKHLMWEADFHAARTVTAMRAPTADGPIYRLARSGTFRHSMTATETAGNRARWQKTSCKAPPAVSVRAAPED
jgi:hypothetical protein